MLPAWHSQPEQKALVGISHLWNQSQFQHYRGDKEGEGGGYIPQPPISRTEDTFPSCNHLLNFSTDVPLLRKAPSPLWLLCPPLETSGRWRRWWWRGRDVHIHTCGLGNCRPQSAPSTFLHSKFPTKLGMQKYGERQKGTGHCIKVFTARINVPHGHLGTLKHSISSSAQWRLFTAFWFQQNRHILLSLKSGVTSCNAIKLTAMTLPCRNQKCYALVQTWSCAASWVLTPAVCIWVHLCYLWQNSLLLDLIRSWQSRWLKCPPLYFLWSVWQIG